MKRINLKCPTCGKGSTIWDTRLPFRKHRCEGKPSHYFFTNELQPCNRAGFWAERGATRKKKAEGMAQVCAVIGSALFGPDIKQHARLTTPQVEIDDDTPMVKTGHFVTEVTKTRRIYTVPQDVSVEP